MEVLMKYESNTKLKRNAAIIKMRKKNPKLSLAEIGRKVGVEYGRIISKQRVDYIIRRGH
jgi:hypothetical protein